MISSHHGPELREPSTNRALDLLADNETNKHISSGRVGWIASRFGQATFSSSTNTQSGPRVQQTNRRSQTRPGSVRPSVARTNPTFSSSETKRSNGATRTPPLAHVRTKRTSVRTYLPSFFLRATAIERVVTRRRRGIRSLSRPCPVPLRAKGAARAHVDFDRYITSLLASKRARARGRAECDGSGSVTTTATTTTTTTRRNVRTRVVP